MGKKLPDYAQNAKTIFIVDDDKGVCDSLQDLFELFHFSVETFNCAIKFLANHNPFRQGCILLDVRMPGMGGIELLKKLVSQNCQAPVIAMSGYNDVPIVVEAIQAGAVDFIMKPLDIDNLLTITRQHLEAPLPKFQHDQFTVLTKREQEVMSLILDGKYNKQIAHELEISISTVEAHRARIMEKYHAKNLAQLIKNYFHISDDCYK